MQIRRRDARLSLLLVTHLASMGPSEESVLFSKSSVLVPVKSTQGQAQPGPAQAWSGPSMSSCPHQPLWGLSLALICLRELIGWSLLRICNFSQPFSCLSLLLFCNFILFITQSPVWAGCWGQGLGSPLVLNSCLPGSLRTIPCTFISRKDGTPGPLNGFYSTRWHFDA